MQSRAQCLAQGKYWINSEFYEGRILMACSLCTIHVLSWTCLSQPVQLHLPELQLFITALAICHHSSFLCLQYQTYLSAIIPQVSSQITAVLWNRHHCSTDSPWSHLGFICLSHYSIVNYMKIEIISFLFHCITRKKHIKIINNQYISIEWTKL